MFLFSVSVSGVERGSKKKRGIQPFLFLFSSLFSHSHTLSFISIPFHLFTFRKPAKTVAHTYIHTTQRNTIQTRTERLDQTSKYVFNGTIHLSGMTASAHFSACCTVRTQTHATEVLPLRWWITVLTFFLFSPSLTLLLPPPYSNHAHPIDSLRKRSCVSLLPGHPARQL